MSEPDYMRQAIAAGQLARSEGNEPYGAAVVRAGTAVVGRNLVYTSGDPTAHAEVDAIRRAAEAFGSHDLRGATLYASFEPCPMCLGAMLASGITHLVIAVRRTLGAAPLGEYRVEDLLALTGQAGAVLITSGMLRDEGLDLIT
jgi:tRNA(adenine34) deaminase